MLEFKFNMILEIEHLLRLDVSWNSGEKSNQNLGKDLLVDQR